MNGLQVEFGCNSKNSVTACIQIMEREKWTCYYIHMREQWHNCNEKCFAGKLQNALNNGMDGEAQIDTILVHKLLFVEALKSD